MDSKSWKKIENESGYPCYIDEATGKESYDHPHFKHIMTTLEKYDDIKYSTYRIAFKIFSLQISLKVPPLRICFGVFARHQLSMSESSLSLDTVELEAVLADIYFAAAKEGLFDGDVDLAVDLLINLLLNIYDGERKSPIRVLGAKTLLILLSEESVNDKWLALADCAADHNGCVSPKRLAALLVHVMALPKYLGCKCDQLQADVDACFDKSAGMLGVTTQHVKEWGAQCCSTRWLALLHRIVASRNSTESAVLCAPCAACGLPLAQVLKFKCSKCSDVFLCEKCYLYDKDLTNVPGHKRTHVVHEIVDGEMKPAECLSFMKSMKKFFFCTKTKKKKTSRKPKVSEKQAGTLKRTKNKPAIFTSTVSKASGNNANNPASTLQDIITQLENQNKALKELTQQLQAAAKDGDGELKEKVESHYSQVSTQINRLKTLKENIISNIENDSQNSKPEKMDRPQAFDLFSPILVDEKQSKVTDTNPPRVLSMDSGNFSVVSKPDNNLLMVSGDALKPVVVHATSDSIATVSMNDMSNWYHDNTNKHNTNRVDNDQSISATEQRYLSDLRSVQTSHDKVKEINADLDTVLDRLQQILTHNFTIDESCFDNTQLRETANEMEGLLGTLIRGVEQRATLHAAKGIV